MITARAGALAVLLLMLWAPAAFAEGAKRVLIVHSFGTGAPPFTTHSTAFAATLAKEMGEPVDLDEISLGMARYPQPELEGAYVEFLAKRLQKWQPDLVAPVGSPAGRFVAKYRSRLFARTPVGAANADLFAWHPTNGDLQLTTSTGTTTIHSVSGVFSGVR